MFFQETQACDAFLLNTGSIQQSYRCEENLGGGPPNYIADFNGSWTVNSNNSPGSGNIVLCIGNRSGSGTSCDIATYNNAESGTGGIGANCPNSSCDFGDLTVFSTNTIGLFATANPRFVIFGCMDPAASNFNPGANTPDGSCTYPVCTDPAASNFNGPLPCQYVCGNGVINPGEVCDGNGFGFTTCGNYGFAAGNLSCINNCQTISTSGCGRYKCTGAGDGCSFAAGDTGGFNQCSPPNDAVCLGACISDGSCSAPVPACGTTTFGVDNCAVSCSRTGPACGGAICGNGVPEAGEQCDAGGSNGSCPASCSTSCAINSCSLPPPTCSSTTPNGDTVTLSQGTRTTFANGVANASSVYFAVWSEANPSVVYYPASDTGGGVWRGDISLADHPTPSLNHVNVYFTNPGSGSPCATADFTLSAAAETLSTTLTASPNAGSSPVNASLTADISGTAAGTVNYSFWWNCAHTGTSVFDVTNGIGGSACGALPSPVAGFCSGDAVGYKCNSIDPAKVSWINPVNVTPSGNSITKTSGANDAWNAGAVSSQAITSGDGYVEFSTGEIGTHKIAGLSSGGDLGQGFNEIEYAFYMQGGPGVQTLYIFESGASACNPACSTGFTQGSYNPGDVLKVSIESGRVKYYQNGILRHDRALTSAYPYIFDTSMYTSAGDPSPTITNANIISSSIIPTITTSAHAYTSTSTAKVIVERGTAPAAQAQAPITVTTPTLTVSFSASPGAVTLGQSTDLLSVVGGTATGIINYNIWWDCAYTDATPTFPEANAFCGAPNLSNNCAANQTLGYKCNAQAATSLTRTYTYLSSGTKRPFVIVERGGFSAMGTAAAGVTVTSPVPTITNTTVTVNNSNYCSAGVHATVNWTYVPAGSPPQSNQVAYRVQIDDDNDPLAGNPEWEQSGTTSTSAITTPCNPAINQITSPQTNCRMSWNTLYRAWVQVQNGYGQWSPWTQMSTYCNGGACGSATSWTTPAHQPPNLKPDPGFSITPSNPSLGSPVIFDDLPPTFDGAATFGSWSWNFGDGSVTNGTDPIIPLDVASTSHTYIANGNYTVRLAVEDELGISCSNNSLISIQKAIPRWREVAPR